MSDDSINASFQYSDGITSSSTIEGHFSNLLFNTRLTTGFISINKLKCAWQRNLSGLLEF